MSALEHLWPRIASRETTEPARKTRLKAVPSPSSRERGPRDKVARAPFVVTLVALLGAGMFGLVVLNTAIQSQASELAQLKSTASRTTNEKAALTSQVQTLRSSASLAQKAQALGMAPNPYPAFIVLPAGTVLGQPTVVKGNELPDQRYETWIQLQTKQENARAQVAAQAKAAEEARKKRLAEEAKKKAAAEAAKKKAAEEAAKKKAAAEAAKKKAEAAKKAAAAKASASAKPSPTPTPTPTTGR